MKPIKPIAWRNRGATIAGVVIWPTVRQRFIDPGELTDRTPSLAAQSKSPAPIDQQRLDALIRILRGTEDGARDWLAFGLDPFLAPSANTRARLLDAAEAYLRGLAGRLEQHLVQDGVADLAMGRQVGDQLAQQVAVAVGLDVGPLAQGVEDAPRDVGS